MSAVGTPPELLTLTPAGIDLRDRIAEVVAERSPVNTQLDEAELSALEAVLVLLLQPKQ